jgi:hypothetical protein
MKHQRKVKRSYYCRCGAHLTVTLNASGNAPTALLLRWRERHSGLGHGLCDRGGARLGRQRAAYHQGATSYASQ